MDHFIENIQKEQRMSREKPHLMVLDGYNFHVTLKVCQKSNQAGLNLSSLSSHTSHGLQPLVVAVFKAFKTSFGTYQDV